MGSILYHGTQGRSLIESVDPATSHMSEYGRGFYTYPGGPGGRTDSFYQAQEVAGWKHGEGGFVYGIEVREDFDRYAQTSQARFLNSAAPVDETLINKVTTSMRELGKDPVSGRDFAAEADKIEARWKSGGYAETESRVFAKNLQYEFGTPNAARPGALTSKDIFHGAGIAGMYVGTNGSVVIYDPDVLPKPKVMGFENPKNPESTAVGRVIGEMNDMPGLNPETDARLRHKLAEAVLDVENGRPDAYQKVTEARRALEHSGVPLSDSMTKQIREAEQASGKIAGIAPEKIEQQREFEKQAREAVESRPPRAEGEGFENYRKRAIEAYDQAHPGAAPEARTAYVGELHDTLYREAQLRYADATGDALAIKNNPDRLERMLEAERRTGFDETMRDVGHVEMESGTYHPRTPPPAAPSSETPAPQAPAAIAPETSAPPALPSEGRPGVLEATVPSTESVHAPADAPVSHAPAHESAKISVGEESHAHGGANVVGRGAAAGQVALDVARGNYGQAAVDAAMATGGEALGSKKSAELAEAGLKMGARLVGKEASHLPGGAGAVFGAGFVAAEVIGNAVDGHYGKAAAATVTGVTEMGVNATGLGLFGGGDLAREFMRNAIGRVFGEEYMPDPSMVGGVAGGAYDLYMEQNGPGGSMEGVSPLAPQFAKARDAQVTPIPVEVPMQSPTVPAARSTRDYQA